MVYVLFTILEQLAVTFVLYYADLAPGMIGISGQNISSTVPSASSKAFTTGPLLRHAARQRRDLL
jgi:hypothetical protein